jgi:predicted DNA-binding transcriptional regulator AlpA
MKRFEGGEGSQGAGAAGKALAVSAGNSTGITPALFTSEQAAAYLGMSEAKFHELRDEPWMCDAIPLGARMVRWARADLDAAIAAMPRQARRASEPAQLLRSKIERAKTTGALATPESPAPAAPAARRYRSGELQ